MVVFARKVRGSMSGTASPTCLHPTLGDFYSKQFMHRSLSTHGPDFVGCSNEAAML